MKNFYELGISGELALALEKQGITSPTPIQEMSIPYGISGCDILASAPTGTGKTLAYALPLISGISSNPQKGALVLVPTRELGMQVYDNVRRIANREIRSSLLIGGDAIGMQLKGLRNNPNFIIATPGRLNDHIKRGSVNLKGISFLVLDETDRMLDMGFEEQIEVILSRLPDERQTLMFSATFPHNIMSISKRYLKDPKVVTLSKEQQPMPKIKQSMVRTSVADKFTHLTKALDGTDGSVLVFVKTKRGADELTDKLRDLDYKASAMHGDLRQNARARTIKKFRDEITKIMVATDVAARGLDIPHIKYVINYDLPQCKEDYVHRIGRTGRAGAEGVSLCLVSPEDNRKWQLIEKMMKNADSSNGIMEDDGYNPYKNQRPSRTSKSDRPRVDSRERRQFGGDKKHNTKRSGFEAKKGSFGSEKKDYKNSSNSYSAKRPKNDFKNKDVDLNTKSHNYKDKFFEEVERPKFNSKGGNFDSINNKFKRKSDKFKSNDIKSGDSFGSENDKYESHKRYKGSASKFNNKFDAPYKKSERPKYKAEKGSSTKQIKDKAEGFRETLSIKRPSSTKNTAKNYKSKKIKY